MAEGLEGTPIVAYNPEDALNFMIKPRLVSDNIINQSFPNFYKRHFGVKNKAKVRQLIKPKHVLQGATSCDEWKPNVKVGMRSYTIDQCQFELMGEHCSWGELQDSCLRNAQQAGNRATEVNPEFTQLQNAIVELVSEGMTDSIYEVSWFGAKGFDAAATNGWNANRASLDDEDKVAYDRLVAQLDICDGWWTKIIQRTQETAKYEKINYVDSYNGGGADATDPSKVQAFLRSLKAAGTSTLRNWNRNRPMEQRPFFLVQDNIMQAYIQSLSTSVGSEQAFQVLVDGVPVPGVYMFDGHIIFSIAEWDMFDDAIGASGKNARALFIAPENLALAIDADSEGSSMGDYALLVQRSTHIRDKGKTWIWSAIKLGVDIDTPELCVASWNSVPLP